MLYRHGENESDERLASVAWRNVNGLGRGVPRFETKAKRAQLEPAGAAANVVLAIPSRPSRRISRIRSRVVLLLVAFSWTGASAASSFRTLSSRGREWLAPVVWRINRQGCVAVCPGSSLSAARIGRFPRQARVWQPRHF